MFFFFLLLCILLEVRAISPANAKVQKNNEIVRL